ncbi:MAG: arylsulfatase A-like enzyme [Lentimonas sp.]|jgi:arylsulfatase A-like enzyme
MKISHFNHSKTESNQHQLIMKSTKQPYPRRQNGLFRGALMAVLLSQAGSLALNADAVSVEKPNILIILTDDQGYAAVSQNPYHPAVISTPNMDSIARNGIVFNQAYNAGNVCSTSRAALLTGRYPQRAQIYTGGEGGSGMALDNLIIPVFLKPAGYVSGAFGKWHLGEKIELSPLKRGFDEFYGFLGRGGHSYFNFDPDNVEKFGGAIYRGLEALPTKKGYLTDLLTDEAIAFIQRNKEGPFFCYLAYNAVHNPIEAPEETSDKYKQAKAYDSKYQEGPKGPIRTYLAMLEHLDRGVGRVLETLQKEGIADNTLIFFLTDNGGVFDQEQFNQPLSGKKHQNWEGGVRTPFFVSWPGRFKAGQIIDAPVIAMDILPTLLDVLNVPLPSDKPLDGKSLLPLIDGKVSNLHDQLFWSDGSTGGWWSARVGDWKMLGRKDQIRLFNLVEDPSEKTDLANKYPEKLTDLRKAFDAWIDPMPDPLSKKSHGNTKRWTPESDKGKKP